MNPETSGLTPSQQELNQNFAQIDTDARASLDKVNSQLAAIDRGAQESIHQEVIDRHQESLISVAEGAVENLQFGFTPEYLEAFEINEDLAGDINRFVRVLGRKSVAELTQKVRKGEILSQDAIQQKIGQIRDEIWSGIVAALGRYGSSGQLANEYYRGTSPDAQGTLPIRDVQLWMQRVLGRGRDEQFPVDQQLNMVRGYSAVLEAKARTNPTEENRRNADTIRSLERTLNPAR